MTEERHDARVRDALQDVNAPPPDPAFRARLKREFASGDVRPALPDASSTAGQRPRGRIVSIAVTVAAAASILLAVALERRARARSWVETSEPGGGARVHTAGERIATGPEETRDLRCGDWVVLQLAPSSEVELPGAPGRLLARTSTGAVWVGELRVVTGRAFAGTTLRLEAACGTVVVTGTTLAVIAGPDSTCLCVLEGRARIVARTGEATAVSEGRRATLFADGRRPVEEEIFPMERMKLEMLRDASREGLSSNGSESR